MLRGIQNAAPVTTVRQRKVVILARKGNCTGDRGGGGNSGVAVSPVAIITIKGSAVSVVHADACARHKGSSCSTNATDRDYIQGDDAHSPLAG